ncbi:protein of unknown function [Xenorhabdus doucetiae]|uniref:Uncharacterized protein n=1 Tax=Xenorhabdus doucetiae TaxID=351671 RepID=A0A068QNT3_9GAMM|nr:protein of unknown function [Xenorhabdus doucetiae]
MQMETRLFLLLYKEKLYLLIDFLILRNMKNSQCHLILPIDYYYEIFLSNNVYQEK